MAIINTLIIQAELHILDDQDTAKAVLSMPQGRRFVGMLFFRQIYACGPNFIIQILREDENNV